uniref:Bcl-2 Bcl-2 homology region 1-3 domain-containing protein n=1 Tax=Tetranychus urticae TaxID=32264 RepID=T1KSE1_TETUR
MNVPRDEVRYRRGTAVGPFIPSHNLLKIPTNMQRKSSLPIIAPLRSDSLSTSTSLSTKSSPLLDLVNSVNVSSKNYYSSYYDRTFGANCSSADDDEFEDEDSSPDTILIESGKRLSAVGLAFGQHLQTMALKFSTNHKDIIDKTRILCARHVRTKLSKSGLIDKRSSLTKLRSMSNIDFDPLLVDLMDSISDLITEMDRRSPGLFDSAIKRSGANVSILSSPEKASFALTVILDEIFIDSISWPKIAAMFGVTGALAVDCATKGKQEYITSLVDTVGNYTENNLARWIHNQGGWSSLIYCYNKESSWSRPVQYLALITFFFILILSIIWFKF